MAQTTTEKHEILGASKKTAEFVRKLLTTNLENLPIAGAKVDIGRCKYDPASSELVYTITVQLLSETGEVAPTKEAIAFEMDKNYLGEPGENTLRGHKVGDVFLHRASNRRFAISGLNTRARKKPILADDVKTGKAYCFATAIFDGPHRVEWEG